jgi:hypothetical protein
VKINDTTYVSLTNVDTKNGGSEATFDAVSLVAAGTGEMRIDDVYVTNGAGAVNTGFLGDIAVETLFPDGNGSSSQWVGSDGNSVDNYLLVEEPTPSTTDYVQSNVAGNRDLYASSSLVRAAGTIYGVQTTAYAQSSDSGPVSLNNLAKSGATVGVGPARALVTTWLPKSSVFELNPDTAAAWTVSEVNGAEFGMEVD